MKNKGIALVVGCLLLCVGCASPSTRSSGKGSVPSSSSPVLSSTPATSVSLSSDSSSITPTVSASHPPSCPAQASGQLGGRRAQAVWFAAPGTQHVYPDARLVLHGCASSGLPVTFALVGDNENCVLSGDVLTAQPAATCFVQASQVGNASYAPAAATRQPYRLASQPVSITWHNPVPTGGTVGQPLPIVLSLTSNAPFLLSSLAVTAAPAEICSAPAEIDQFQGPASTIATFNLQLRSPGNCSVRIAANESQFVVLTSVAGQLQLSIGPHA